MTRINPNKKYYPFIANNMERVSRAMDIILKPILNRSETLFDKNKNQQEISFIDIGCGYGNVVYFVRGYVAHFLNERYEHYKRKEVFLNCFGLEYDKRIIPKDRRGNPDRGFKIGNALTFKDYADYDIIYYYCPIEDRQLQRRLEKKIENDMKVGAYLLAFNKQRGEIANDDRFFCISDFVDYFGGNIYQKIKA